MARSHPDPVMEESGNKRMRFDDGGSKSIRGRVVLMKKNVMDFNDLRATYQDGKDELLGNKVSLQLISAVHGDPAKNLRGKVGNPAYLENWILTNSLTAKDLTYNVTFEWDEEIGVPGAFIIRNHHRNEFYLKTLTLEDVPGCGEVHFICNSWVYNQEHYTKDRVFFTNQPYLPSQTPAPLIHYREEELESLRGNGTGKREEWERIYDYDVYNDLGIPDQGQENARKTLGGSSEYPYPRRGRTGRAPSADDPKSESRLPLNQSFDIYVPRDERFSHVKMSDFTAYAVKAILQFLVPEFKDLLDRTPNEFDKFEDVLKLYEGGIEHPKASLLDNIGKYIPSEFIKELLRVDGEQRFKFPMPQVIQDNTSAWRTDEEFGREMLAGLNPVVIRRLQEFPPPSKLDPEQYGTSCITEEHIKANLEGFTVDEALKNNRLYIVDYHDALMPYLNRINSTATKTYAARTVLFLKRDGTLRPVAIELSKPHSEGDELGVESEVYTPAEDGAEGTIWQLAKAYAAVNDSGYHQLICHWLQTHCVIEPFIIATNRQLSVIHPVYKLLHPHFRDTMFINAFARQTLINAGGILEFTVFPGKFAMEMSAVVYKNWDFTKQALPADLLQRGVAVEDLNSPHGVRLLIEDYPFAVDGLEIWSAIKNWVKAYCQVYYKDDEMVQNDTELQSWWKEVREKGHGDKKDEPWWPKMQTVEELIDSCTIIIWTASALHAAINFGQYPYGGYLPNRPSTSRRFMPKAKPGTPEYEELKTEPEKVYLRTITAQLQTVIGISLIEILSMHSQDEVFLGDRESKWTSDTEADKAFEEFGEKLKEIEEGIIQMNKDGKLRNRFGPVNMDYTLLIPSSEVGLTGRGIPNSVSI